VKHDPNGPSKLNQREGCPGSYRLETNGENRDLPDILSPEMESEASKRGRFLHEIIASCLVDGTRPTVDMLTTASGESFESDVQALEDCYDYAMEKLAGNPIDGTEPLVLIEHRVDLTAFGIATGGTLDLALVWPGRTFFLVDWKFGFSPTRDPLYNRQMHAYASALVDNFGCVDGTAAIVQPFGLGIDPIRTAYYEPEQLSRFGSEIRSIVAATQVPDAPLRPGDHCQWCKVKFDCPARKAQAEAIIAQRAQRITHTIGALDPDKRAHYVEQMKLAKAWLEGALSEVDLAIIGGSLAVPGFVVAEGRKSRKWLDEGSAQLAMTDAGIPDERMYKREMLSPAEAEKVVGKTRAVKLKPAITIVPGKPRVVREGTTGAIDE
jgi:hypothetical protein